MHNHSCPNVVSFFSAGTEPEKNKIKPSILFAGSLRGPGEKASSLNAWAPQKGSIVRRGGGVLATMAVALPWQRAYGGASLYGRLCDVATACVCRRRWHCHGSGVRRRLSARQPALAAKKLGLGRPRCITRTRQRRHLAVKAKMQQTGICGVN